MENISISIVFKLHNKTDIDTQHTTLIGYTEKGVVNAIITEDNIGQILWVQIIETPLEYHVKP